MEAGASLSYVVYFMRAIACNMTSLQSPSDLDSVKRKIVEIVENVVIVENFYKFLQFLQFSTAGNSLQNCQPSWTVSGVG